ncbi:MAG: glycosyltransferase involved in cell wall biosynthesis [Paraglaciecola sp.]
MKLNHVMSSDLNSGIFADLIAYSRKYSSESDDIIVSNQPVDGCDAYHYHRPQLESFLVKKSIVTVHHDLNDDDKWHLFKNFEKQYRQANKIICLNTIQQKSLKKIGFKNTVVIPHGYDKNIFSAQEKSAKKVVNLGIISKRYGRKVKGEALLYDLFKRLDREKIRFTFIGKDRTQDCWKARDLGYEAEVFERLPYRVFGSVYENLDALLIPSIYEGGPANLPEAISSGTPVIARNVGMVGDYVDETNGIILTGEPNADAVNINKFATDEAYQLEIKRGAYTKSKQALTWEEVTKMQFELYSKVIK